MDANKFSEAVSRKCHMQMGVLYICLYILTHTYTYMKHIIWLQGVTMRYCWLFFGFEYAFLPSLFDPFTYIYFR